MNIITQTGLLFYPLAGLSLLGLALIIERGLFFVRLPRLRASQDFENLSALLAANKTLPKDVRDDLISTKLCAIKNHWENGIHVLRTIAVLSPMLGLLGTVIGMIKAFKDISAQTGPVAPNMIADGLWSAMITTAYGLTIALPCLFAAFIFARIAEKRLAALQEHLNEQSLIIEGAQLS